jgi:hypothetical protein
VFGVLWLIFPLGIILIPDGLPIYVAMSLVGLVMFAGLNVFMGLAERFGPVEPHLDSNQASGA